MEESKASKPLEELASVEMKKPISKASINSLIQASVLMGVTKEEMYGSNSTPNKSPTKISRTELTIAKSFLRRVSKILETVVTKKEELPVGNLSLIQKLVYDNSRCVVFENEIITMKKLHSVMIKKCN